MKVTNCQIDVTSQDMAMSLDSVAMEISTSEKLGRQYEFQAISDKFAQYVWNNAHGQISVNIPIHALGNEFPAWLYLARA